MFRLSCQIPTGITEISQAQRASRMSRKLGRSSKLINAGSMTTDMEDLQEFFNELEEEEKKDEIEEVQEFVCDPEFESMFEPEEMRLLALVAHNHMKPAMKEFVLAHFNLLKKFRLTGTGTTMKMLREVFGEEHMKEFGGPICKSGPLGGDAELVALMCTENLGGIFFFQDPMDAHPHGPDIDCLNRQANVYNIMTATNPSSAHAMTFVLRQSLMLGEETMIPSFFLTCESPSVAEYKKRQQALLKTLS